MKPFDVIVLTEQRYINDSDDAYKHNVFYEDELVVNALKELGLKAGRKAWDDATFDWLSTKAVIFRTIWDYFDRFDEFSVWLKEVTTKTRLINSKDLIYWNIDKHYLLDLQKKGINIPETELIEIGTKATLKALHEQTGWTDTVLKPCISGSARHTYKLNAENLEEHEAIFKELIEKEAMLLQTFQHNIVSKGEISMMLFNGTFTHAVIKKAKTGDFRVQDDFGGTVGIHQPNAEEIAFAKAAVNACPEMPLYARADIFYDNNNQLAIAELELIEPELWFRLNPSAANALAKATKAILQA